MNNRIESEIFLKVHFIVAGENNETQIRTFDDRHRAIFQRGNIDAFVMSVPK
jgi:hypothetical protein